MVVYIELQLQSYHWRPTADAESCDITHWGKELYEQKSKNGARRHKDGAADCPVSCKRPNGIFKALYPV